MTETHDQPQPHTHLPDIGVKVHDVHDCLVHRRGTITAEQIHKFELYAAEMFSALGMDLQDPATRETPRRFVQAMLDITNGYDGDPKLLTIFRTECRGGPDCRTSQLVEGPIR